MGPCYLKEPDPASTALTSLIFQQQGVVFSRLYQKQARAYTDYALEIWRRLGIPDKIQGYNVLTFRGNNKYPKGMGSLIRMCLHNNVEPWFIPMAEPWRPGKSFSRKCLFLLSKNWFQRSSLLSSDTTEAIVTAGLEAKPL